MISRQQRAEAEHDAQDEEQHQHVAEDGDQAGGEQVVQHVHVGGHAGDQAAHRIAVVEGEVEVLQVLHELAAQVEHGELAGVLHEVHLDELADEIAGEDGEVEQPDAGQPAPAGRRADSGSRKPGSVRAGWGCM